MSANPWMPYESKAHAATASERIREARQELEQQTGFSCSSCGSWFPSFSEAMIHTLEGHPYTATKCIPTVRVAS